MVVLAVPPAVPVSVPTEAGAGVPGQQAPLCARGRTPAVAEVRAALPAALELGAPLRAPQDKVGPAALSWLRHLLGVLWWSLKAAGAAGVAAGVASSVVAGAGPPIREPTAVAEEVAVPA